MPTYDYDCESCAHNFELFQSISEPPAEKCPNCGGAVKRRIHGGAGLIFKGSGFYLTDYKKAGNNASADGKSEAGEKKPSGDEKAKSDETKPSKDKGSDKGTSEGTNNASKK